MLCRLEEDELRALYVGFDLVRKNIAPGRALGTNPNKGLTRALESAGYRPFRQGLGFPYNPGNRPFFEAGEDESDDEASSWKPFLWPTKGRIHFFKAETLLPISNFFIKYAKKKKNKKKQKSKPLRTTDGRAICYYCNAAKFQDTDHLLRDCLEAPIDPTYRADIFRNSRKAAMTPAKPKAELVH